MTLQDGRKLACSGDTRPCPRFAQAAQGTTLLIHEATFAPELQAMVQPLQQPDPATIAGHDSQAECTALAECLHAPAGLEAVITRFTCCHVKRSGLQAGTVNEELAISDAGAFSADYSSSLPTSIWHVSCSCCL